MTTITATPATFTQWVTLHRTADAAITAFDAQADLVERLALDLAAAQRALGELAAEKDEAIAAEYAAHQSADAASRASLDH